MSNPVKYPSLKEHIREIQKIMALEKKLYPRKHKEESK